VRGVRKMKKVFREGKAGTLHSGSKHGPLVRHGSKQEIAIALNSKRRVSVGVRKSNTH
jgi:hypothetical protein